MNINKKTITRGICAVLALAMIISLLLSSFTSFAAGGITSKDVRFTLKKGKTTTFQTYIPGVGLKTHKAKITKYKVTKDVVPMQTSSGGNKLVTANRLQATIEITAPSYTAKEIKKFRKTGAVYLDTYDVSFLSTKTGKCPLLVRPMSTKQQAVVDYIGANERTVKLGNNKTYKYYGKAIVKVDCCFIESDKVAVGVVGCTKNGSTNFSKAEEYHARKIAFKKTNWYSKNNKNLSAWKKIN